MKALFASFLLIIITNQSALAASSSFKMYRSMFPKVSPNCDIHTEMTLVESGNVIKEVTLTEKVSGVCEIFVAPNPRTYQLEVNKAIVDSKCGSVYYLKHVNDDLIVSLVDNRNRSCEYRVPNDLIISEKNSEEVGKTLYSYPKYQSEAEDI